MQEYFPSSAINNLQVSGLKMERYGTGYLETHQSSEPYAQHAILALTIQMALATSSTLQTSTSSLSGN